MGMLDDIGLFFEHMSLLEYKRDITATRLGKNILDGLLKDTYFEKTLQEYDPETKIDIVLSELEEIDPTQNKQYVPWLAKNYGDFLMSDADQVHTLLNQFFDLKTSLTKIGKSTDIGQYSIITLKQLIDEIHAVEFDLSNVSSEKDDQEDVVVFYDGPYGKLLSPSSEKAACAIGSGTKWCTSAKNDNKFGLYTEDGDRIYIWIAKSGKKYQFYFDHFEFEFMDSRDRSLDFDELQYFMVEHPILHKFFIKFANIYPSLKNVLVVLSDENNKEAQMKMIQKNPTFIRFIRNPSPEMQRLAIGKDKYAVRYINNQLGRFVRQEIYEVFMNAIPEIVKTGENNHDVELSICKIGKHRLHELYMATVGPTENYNTLFKKQALDIDGRHLRYFRDADRNMQIYAIQKDVSAIKFIENPDKDVQLIAVKSDGRAIEFINNPDKDVQLAAVNQNGYAIKFIENPDKDVQLAAVKQNGYAIADIEKPDKDVQLASIKNNGYENFTKHKFSREVIQWARENEYI